MLNHDLSAFFTPSTFGGVKNAKAHLAIYRITPSLAAKVGKTRDQFGTRIVNASRTVLLAVPAQKGKWQVAED